MSPEQTSEHAEPLLGEQKSDEDPYVGEPAVRKRARWRCGFLVPVLTVLTALAVTSALFMLLTYTPRAPATSESDIKLVLHPEDHVSREPRVVRLSWNISKARLSPDGVQRDVILVNGQQME